MHVSQFLAREHAGAAGSEMCSISKMHKAGTEEKTSSKNLYSIYIMCTPPSVRSAWEPSIILPWAPGELFSSRRETNGGQGCE